MLKVEPELVGKLEAQVNNLSLIAKGVEEELDRIPSVISDIKRVNESIKELQDIVCKISNSK